MRIKGILFEHGKDNYELWQGFQLTEEELDAIMNILEKHQKEGRSVSGDGRKVAKSIIDGYITKKQAKEFYTNLREICFENKNTSNQGIMCETHIADLMGISEERANAFCTAMIKYGITERQGGKIVV